MNSSFCLAAPSEMVFDLLKGLVIFKKHLGTFSKIGIEKESLKVAGNFDRASYFWIMGQGAQISYFLSSFDVDLRRKSTHEERLKQGLGTGARIALVGRFSELLKFGPLSMRALGKLLKRELWIPLILTILFFKLLTLTRMLKSALNVLLTPQELWWKSFPCDRVVLSDKLFNTKM